MPAPPARRPGSRDPLGTCAPRRNAASIRGYRPAGKGETANMPGLRPTVAHVSMGPVGRSLFVAGLQSAGVPGDPAATLARFERDVRTVGSWFDGVELVVAPELHLMAIPPLLGEGGPSESELAVDVPGELTERLGALARETGLWL